MPTESAPPLRACDLRADHASTVCDAISIGARMVQEVTQAFSAANHPTDFKKRFAVLSKIILAEGSLLDVAACMKALEEQANVMYLLAVSIAAYEQQSGKPLAECIAAIMIEGAAEGARLDKLAAQTRKDLN